MPRENLRPSYGWTCATDEVMVFGALCPNWHESVEDRRRVRLLQPLYIS